MKVHSLPGIRAALCSECGARAGNEDAVSVGQYGPGWYAVLADGAGGHRQGAEAARRAVQRLQACLYDATLPWNPESLTQAVMAAHEDVCRGQTMQGADRMHTTLVALCIDALRGFALWTHVGDSRLYRLRDGVIDIVTRDDTVVYGLLEAGVLTPAQAQRHPHRNQLIAALGIPDALEPHTVARQALKDGDVFLLCSDGWWASAGDALITSSLANADTPEQWLAAMREGIMRQCRPDQDNFSAIALWVERSDCSDSK
ncbi:MAG TPA: protein phosphatase 2C domain-containing protein [Burkholderiaceae bacterium]|nr:protein phosphatase 2C domain-containing protein [Burkholderiaceae bacterium]